MWEFYVFSWVKSFKLSQIFQFLFYKKQIIPNKISKIFKLARIFIHFLFHFQFSCYIEESKSSMLKITINIELF